MLKSWKVAWTAFRIMFPRSVFWWNFCGSLWVWNQAFLLASFDLSPICVFQTIGFWNWGDYLVGSSGPPGSGWLAFVVSGTWSTQGWLLAGNDNGNCRFGTCFGFNRSADVPISPWPRQFLVNFSIAQNDDGDFFFERLWGSRIVNLSSVLFISCTMVSILVCHSSVC